MTRIPSIVLLAVTVLTAVPTGGAAQAPAATLRDADTIIRNLGSLDYPTRMNAARLLRRAPAAEAVPLLTQAVKSHADEFVRHRAFIVLTSFNDRGTGDVARGLLSDRNDRLRESAYKWLEQHPDARLTQALLGALQTEQAEFVRPALIGALAALDQDAQVQRALLTEVGRGLDFFRSAVIDALGRHHAVYALDAIGPVTRLDGPLQQEAILATGRIGGTHADIILAAIPPGGPDTSLTARAAGCLAGRDCATQIPALATAATAAGTRPVAVRAAIAGLAAIGESENALAIATLIGLPERMPALRQDVAVAFAGLAVRKPIVVLEWLDESPEASRIGVIDLLKEGFDSLEEDYAEEQFFAATRAMYWEATDGSPTRTLTSTLIQRLEF